MLLQMSKFQFKSTTLPIAQWR